MSDSFQYYELGPLLASKGERIRAIVRETCAIHDSRTFESRRMDGKPIAPDDRLTPRGLQIWWRTSFPASDPREGEWFQWMTCVRPKDATHASLQTSFRSACAALAEVPEFRSTDARGLAGLVDIRLPHVPRPAFIGAFELFAGPSDTEPPALLLSWHPNLAGELLVSIARRSLPPQAK